MSHFISKSCEGEKCSYHFTDPRVASRSDLCGGPASHKVQEEILHDDPEPIRHPLTSYLCCFHFSRVMGRPCEAAPKNLKPKKNVGWGDEAVPQPKRSG
jgi:hypothetical protein